eukprot:c47617_g1_i1.p1 GENE.c47617_g1_i1~~c47617_g1_i1.p1  ORF type:complete len:104 (+),score=10.65 c47617_g1_i1:40-351(+)
MRWAAIARAHYVPSIKFTYAMRNAGKGAGGAPAAAAGSSSAPVSTAAPSLTGVNVSSVTVISSFKALPSRYWPAPVSAAEAFAVESGGAPADPPPPPPKKPTK